MINTPEFWVGISFVVCIVLSYKLIFPTLRAGLVAHQTEIERLFSESEALLQASERKFSLIQEQLDALPNLITEMEKEFDSKVNHLLQEWMNQKEKITMRYHALREHKLEHLQDHATSQCYERMSNLCVKVLQAYVDQHLDAKQHQQLVMHALKDLPSAE